MGKKAAAGKKVPQAPLSVNKGSSSKKSKDSLFEKRARNFRIGGDILPKLDLTRFVKWPKFIRLQRQKRILVQRLKVPPTIAQFQHTVDKAQFTSLARVLKKIAPETRAQKKERLQGEAAAGGKAKKAGLPALTYGINDVTSAIEQKKAKLVVIAHDVDPIEIVCWLPALCRKFDVPYCVVKGKSRLGQFVNKKTCSALAITTSNKEDSSAVEQLCTNFKAAFNDNVAVHRKWGGGVQGVKSYHITRARQIMLEKEQAKKTGLAM